MREDFVILSVMGWVWAALVGLFLLVRLSSKSRNTTSQHSESPHDSRF